MFSEKDAPYLLLILFSGLGWLVTTIADNLTNAPTLTYYIQSEPGAGLRAYAFYVSNISRTEVITVEKLNFAPDGAVIVKQPSCFQVINVSPHSVSEDAIPILSGGKEGSCDLPLSVENLTFAPGANLGLKTMLQGQGTLLPFLVSAHADQKGDDAQKGVRFVSGTSIEAIIANNLVEVYMGLFLTAIAGVVLLLLARSVQKGACA